MDVNSFGLKLTLKYYFDPSLDFDFQEQKVVCQTFDQCQNHKSDTIKQWSNPFKKSKYIHSILLWLVKFRTLLIDARVEDQNKMMTSQTE